jgi:amino acid transporter
MSKSQEQPQLNRALSGLGALFIVLSAITPASSVFIILPIVISIAGTGSFLTMMVAAIIGLFMAFVYAELSSAYPTAGGEYTMIGNTLGKFWGFLTMIVILITIILIIAIIAMGVGTYLGVVGVAIDPRITGVITIIAAGLIGILGIKSNAVITGIFLGIELIALAILVILGFANYTQPVSSLISNPQVLDAASNALAPAPWAAILAATAVGLFAYNGYGAAAYFGEETKDARSSIGRIVVYALIITVISEALPLLAVLVGSPDVAGLLAAPQKIEYFLEARGGHTLTVILSLAIALAIFNAVIAIVLQGARLLYATGRDNTWPTAINGAIASIHASYQSPWIATIVVAVLSCAACFIDMNTLFVVTGTSLIAVYALLCIATILGRRNGTTAHGAYRMPGFPIPAILALAALAYIAWQNYLDPNLGRPSLIATALMFVAAAIYYGIFLARRADWQPHAAKDQ